MVEAFEVEIVERGGLDPWLDHAKGAPGDDDLAGLGLVAQP